MANFDRQLKNLMKFDNLEKPVKAHLKNVYSCLSISLLAAAAGSYIHLFTNILSGGLLTTIAGIGLLIGLMMTPHSKENNAKRMTFLSGFAFCVGLGLGPLMEVMIRIDPSIIPTAFLGTSAIFLCFTLSALLTNDRKWLYLGGTLMSGLSWLLILGFANIFFRSQLLFEVHLYLGFVIMCAFVLYDTQLIVEKRRRGDDDYIWHSVDLFMDFVSLFQKLMIILGNKENKKKRKD